MSKLLSIQEQLGEKTEKRILQSNEKFDELIPSNKLKYSSIHL